MRNRVLACVAGAAFIAIFALGVPFPCVVPAAAIVAVIGGRHAPGAFTGPQTYPESGRAHLPAVLDEHTPLPAHARFTWPRVMRVAGIGLFAFLPSFVFIR